MKTLRLLSLVLAIFWAKPSRCSAVQPVAMEGENIRIEFDAVLHSRLVAKFNGRNILIGEFTPSESIQIAGKNLQDFPLTGQKQEKVQDKIGSGQRLILEGSAGTIRKTVIVSNYVEFPRMSFFEVHYTNMGSSDLSIDSWTNHHYSISAAPGSDNAPFWSYQSGSYEPRPDWVLPLKAGFSQDNFMGMNDTDYGGGTPVVDVWRSDVGIGVGHVELVPKPVSLPVTMPDRGTATVAIKFTQPQIVKAGATLKTLRTFVAVHQRDYFETLREYRHFMVRQGIRFDPAPAVAFSPIWCAWGYGRDFTPAQVINALPMTKKLGFGWVTLDDGWQTAEGDWYLDKKKFPKGDQDMKAMVEKIHAEGFKAQLWWAPLAVKPDSELFAKHPEQLLRNSDGSKQKISYWNSWYLCPADPAVIEYHRAMVVKIMKDWDFDGLKLDGQFMNGAPPCFNPAHKHRIPEAAVEGMPLFFKMIYDTARSIKPEALVEFCPCGTAYSFFTMPYMNMSVASDPRSSWQIRLKGKTLKALMGDEVAYFGDHVDMSDGGNDFASTVGIGGVPGSNFTWPVGSSRRTRNNLTPEKEQIWDQWIRIYKEKMLSRGKYLGALYDIGFDKPEAHVIRKEDRFYYAFYAPEWDGPVELRGLDKKRYRVIDYEIKRDLGKLSGPVASMRCEFKKHLLLEVRPE